MKSILKIFACIALLAGCCLAQQKKADPQQVRPAASGSEKTTAIGEPSQNVPSRETAETSRDAAKHNEAGESDEAAQFKYSASVQSLGRHLGISTEKAYWLSVVLNFAVIAVLIAIGMKRMLPGMFRARTGEIQKGMEAARRASEDANRRLKEIEAKLSRLGSEITALHETASGQARDEEIRLKAAVEEERQKIIRTAEQEIAAAAGSARRELRAYAAELAVGLAEKKIKVDASTDQALIRDFVEQLRRNGE